MPHVESNAAKIYYEVRGTGGPPLVLLRGFASPIETWNGVDHELAADHVTVVLDNRGTGRSTAPRGSYRVASMADDVAAVLHHAGLDSSHVVGTSLGGMIAQELAIRHPQRVRSLVLVATTPGKRGGFPLRARGVASLVLGTFMPRPIRMRLVRYATLSPDGRRARQAVDDVRPGAPAPPRTLFRGLIGQASAIFAHDMTDRLDRIAVPTLVIHGGADNLIDYDHARQLASLIPAARFEFWEQAGHDLATEAPQRLAESVRRHVQAVIQNSESEPRLHCSA